MPPQRTPLGPSSSNRQPYMYLSPYYRGGIVYTARFSHTATEIVTGTGFDCYTVRYTLEQDPERAEGKSLPKKPRNKSYTEPEERLLVRHVRNNLKDTYTQLILACGLSYKKRTLTSILEGYYITR
ncbi:hypothetical protein G7Y89_g1357 [Cudoniella acicularis]|uniref:Uncharacterized protein n=1 Tax=Cudoniella acicularis TaxID=354080 RepID=A0A8H4W727_9HELO|nr:hypothetical protein G7Y89_g1357 [Cudoniella acicularis]